MSSTPPVAPVFFRLQATIVPVTPAGPNRFVLWYQCAVLSVAVFALFANLPIYGYVLNPGLLPKYSFFLLFLLMAPLVLAHQRALADYLQSPFVFWAAALVAVNLIHLASWAGAGDIGSLVVVDNLAEARAGLIQTRIQYILFALVFGFAVYTLPGKAYLYGALALAILQPCAVILDFLQPGLLYPIDMPGAVLGRAAAFFINPTMAGEALLLVFVLACAVVGKRWRAFLFLLCGAAVLATFSRSSIIAWVLLLFLLTYRKSLPRGLIVAGIATLPVLVFALGYFESYLDSREGFEAASGNLLSRLDFFSSYNFDDDSSEERASVAAAGLELFLQNPVFGAGAGATLFWAHRGSTHNQLLLLAAEYGVFGIGLWTWLLVILWRGRYFEDRGLQLAMVFLYLFMSMFTHQMIDAASYWLATFAMAAARPPVPEQVLRQQGRRRLQSTRLRYAPRGVGDTRRIARSGGRT